MTSGRVRLRPADEPLSERPWATVPVLLAASNCSQRSLLPANAYVDRIRFMLGNPASLPLQMDPVLPGVQRAASAWRDRPQFAAAVRAGLTSCAPRASTQVQANEKAMRHYSYVRWTSVRVHRLRSFC